MAKEYRDPVVRKASKDRYGATEKGKKTRKRAQVDRALRMGALAKKEGRPTPREIICPHCTGHITLAGNSSFVLKKKDVGAEFQPEDYHPNPDRTYKVPEAERRRQLAWYWRNREKVLAREKAKRTKIKALLGTT